MAVSSLVKCLPLLAACVTASASFPTIPTDLTTPVQQRLAIIGPNAVSVGWNTYEQLSDSCVQYGTSSDSLTSQSCSDTSATYATSRTYSNAVTLTGLTPATTYYYKIVSTNSSVEHFISPRTAGDTTPFAMDVVIDLGVYGADGFTIEQNMTKRDTIPTVDPSLTHTTISSLAQTVDDYEFIIHPGDFAYADDWYLKSKNLLDGEEAFEAILEEFYDQLAPVAGRKAYMASPGNHDADCSEILAGTCPTGQNNFTDFMNRFGKTMPTAFASKSSNSTAVANAATAKALANPPFWYSFEYGMAHVVMIDTETDFPNAPDAPGGSQDLNSGPFGATGQQLAFLEADLASVDRTVTPWVIVGGHRAWYSTGGSDNICSPCQTAFESVFYKYGVDLGIFGHVHNSQRFVPVYNGVADANGYNNPAAPMYIVAGGAGNIEGLSEVGTNLSTNAFAYADDFSYARVSFLNSTHLQVDFIDSATTSILDTSTLYKKHAEQFVVQT